MTHFGVTSAHQHAQARGVSLTVIDTQRDTTNISAIFTVPLGRDEGGHGEGGDGTRRARVCQ